MPDYSNHSEIENILYSALCNVDLFCIGFTGTSKEICDIICHNTEISSIITDDKVLYHRVRECLQRHNNCRDNLHYGSNQLRDISKVFISDKHCLYTFGRLF